MPRPEVIPPPTPEQRRSVRSRGRRGSSPSPPPTVTNSRPRSRGPRAPTPATECEPRMHLGDYRGDRPLCRGDRGGRLWRQPSARRWAIAHRPRRLDRIL